MTHSNITEALEELAGRCHYDTTLVDSKGKPHKLNELLEKASSGKLTKRGEFTVEGVEILNAKSGRPVYVVESIL